MSQTFDLPGHPDIACEADFETGMITMRRGAASAIIDTKDMTREDISTALAVGVYEIERQEEQRATRKRRRRAEALSRKFSRQTVTVH